MFKREIITTNDGSHSLSVPEMNEQYHSIHGAKQEAEHVFLKMGLDFFSDVKELRVLEVGFGTGLNALLTLNYAENNGKNIDFYSLEKYPVVKEEYELLNYGALVNRDEQFLMLHKAAWEEKVSITDSFRLTKLNIDLKKDIVPGGMDVVYFDAFAPNKQGDMWSLEVFKKMFDCLKSGGCLVTYCCQGQAKRTMLAAGFNVEKVPGPPGKREMLRAIKP